MKSKIAAGSEPFYRWVIVVASAVMLAVSMGMMVNGVSVFLIPLNEEFGWIVSRSVKRESLGKDAFEFAAVLRGFEANLACVKGKRETKGELKSLDTQL